MHALCLQRHYHAGMAVSVTVRHVPDDVRDVLASRAAQQGRSLQEYLLGEMTRLAARPTAAEVIRRARDRAAASGSPIDAQTILSARDADRR